MVNSAGPEVRSSGFFLSLTMSGTILFIIIYDNCVFVYIIKFTIIHSFSVMEVACGEYGDMVPSLVVAVRNCKCEQFQKLRKFVNCDTAKYSSLDDLKENAILDDNLSDHESAQANGAIPKNMVLHGRGATANSCEVSRVTSAGHTLYV